MGCYIDDAKRDLVGELVNFKTKNTIDACISYCLDRSKFCWSFKIKLKQILNKLQQKSTILHSVYHRHHRM